MVIPHNCFAFFWMGTTEKAEPGFDRRKATLKSDRAKGVIPCTRTATQTAAP